MTVMPDDNKLVPQGGGEGRPTSTTEEVLRVLREHRKPPNGDDDPLTNPELEKLFGSLSKGLEEGIPDTVLGMQPAGPLTLEELAAVLAQPSVLGESPMSRPTGETVVACAKCGSANPAATRFCGMCGHDLVKSSSATKASDNGTAPAAAVQAEAAAVRPGAAARRSSGRGWKAACLALLCLVLGLVVYQQQLWQQPVLMNWISSSQIEPPAPAPVVTASAPAKTGAAPASLVRPQVPTIRQPNNPAKPPKTAPPTTVRQPLPGPAPLASPSPQPVELPAAVEAPDTAVAENATVTPEPEPVEASSVPVPPGPVKILQGVAQGALIFKVAPEYPAVARAARVQGSVLMHAIIGTDGTVQRLQVVGGNPLLVNAAMEAVKRWRYRPYLLDGRPVEVETSITVNFKGE